MKKALFTIFTILLFSVQCFALVSEYSFRQSIGTYSEINNGITLLNDNITMNIPIGFDFMFDDDSYSELNVSSNGFIYFGTEEVDYNIRRILEKEINSDFKGAIAAYCAKLENNQEKIISYKTIGTAPDRVMVIQWKDCNQRYYENYEHFYLKRNFQIRLYEGTNNIEFIYGNFDTLSISSDRRVQVGLKGSSNNLNIRFSETRLDSTNWGFYCSNYCHKIA
jgi:hypothetical protein